MQYRRYVFASLSLSLVAATPALANSRDFLTKAIKGDNSEMKLGALAAGRGSSQAVRDFGTMLERDHSNARRKAVPVAKAHGIAVPTAMMPEAKAEYGKLQRLHGSAFDREFSRYMVSDHEKDVADFKKEAESRDPADVRALAKETLPTLEKHLQSARSIR